MADKPYRDPKTTKIEDWKWRPLENIKAELALKAIPDYIQKGFGGFMTEQAGRSQRGEMSPRDLLKAYTIAQSSIGRGGLSHATATKTGMRLPDTGGEVRPEGSYSEWLGSPAGQKYLDAAERGQINHEAINDLRGKFAPFGKQNDQAEKMAYAAMTIPGMAEHLNEALTGSTDEYRDFAEKLKGIAGAKSGFIGSLLGRGDLPTLDARQLNLHTDESPVGVGSMMNRGKGRGAREAVDRLASRQAAMGFDIDPSLEPHYQHLAHHAVWDKTSGTETTHDDLMKAMRGYAQGGDVNPTTDQMRQALDHYAKGGQREMDVGDYPAGHIEHTPSRPAPAVVGTRFKVDEPYGLAPERKVDLYNYKGANAMLLPWDSTSRNVAIRGVSGHDLPKAVTTHGGIPFSRDLEHMERDIIGASGPEISQRVADRVDVARKENREQGGTGQILHMPTTMAKYNEGFSLSPAELVFQLHERAKQHPDYRPEHTNELEELVRNAGGKERPFRGFVGFRDPEAYARQIRTGEGLDNPANAGELRKAINQKLIYGKRAQKLMDFNAEDAINAMTVPSLRGVPKGFIGSSLMSAPEGRTILTPSDSNRDPYGTRFSGKYEGTLGENVPASVIFGSKVPSLEEEFHFVPRKKPDIAGPMQLNTSDMRNMVLGALEKRKHGISQLIDNEVLDRYSQYLMNRDKWLRKGQYAEGGEVDTGPTHDEMLAHIMLHKAGGGAVQPDAPDGMSSDSGYYEGGPSDMAGTDPMQYRADGGSIKPSNVGVEEAPDMPVKLYMPPGGEGEQGMPVGGVDFQPEAPGHQLSLAPQGQPGQPPQGAQAPQGMPPQGALGQPPQGQPQGPRSNILQMTPQGQAMAAMRATPPQPAMPRMAEGGSTNPSVEEMRRAIAGAAKSAGMKEPVVANKQLTNMQDFHTSLGDKIRARAMDMQDMVESMPFKYDKGHRVFTEDSAKKNKAPYTIVRRVPFGNQVVREEGTLRTVRDPQTGKAMRTPYEPGYHVRHEEGDDWSEFHIPESAIKGRVKMAGGGMVGDIDIEERPL